MDKEVIFLLQMVEKIEKLIVMGYNVNNSLFILTIVFIFSYNGCLAQNLDKIVSKFDFGDEFEMKINNNFKIFDYDFEKLNKQNIYKTQINNKKYFMYLIDEDCRFKFIFRSKLEYLNKNYGSVTDARDFLLYDKLNKKILLLKSNNRGLITNMNDTLTIFNSINCLGRNVTLLTDNLEEYKSLESINEYNCMNVFFDEDEIKETTQSKNTEKKLYKKLLKTKDVNTIQIEDIDNRLFMMDLDIIYELLE